MKIMDVRTNYVFLLSIADKKLPVKLAYAISRNIDVLQKEYERAETQRIKLCEQYAAKDADGKSVMTKSVINGQPVEGYQIDDSRQSEFSDQLSDLFGMDVDVAVMTVDGSVIDALDSDRYDPLTAAQLHDLQWMIKEHDKDA